MLVLFENHLCLCEFSYLVCTVTDVCCSRCCPCIAVSFNKILSYRHICGECAEFVEIRNINSKNNCKLLAVFGSSNIEALLVAYKVTFIVIHFHHFSIAVDYFEHVTVVCTCCRVSSSVPCVNEVLSCKLCAVAPLEVITECECVSCLTVFKKLALGEFGSTVRCENSIAVSVIFIAYKTGEYVNNVGTAVNCRV